MAASLLPNVSISLYDHHKKLSKPDQKLGWQNYIKVEAGPLPLGRCFRCLLEAGVFGVSRGNTGIIKIDYHSYVFFHTHHFKSKSALFLYRQLCQNHFKTPKLQIPANILCLNKIILILDLGVSFSGILFISLKYPLYVQLNVTCLHV